MNAFLLSLAIGLAVLLGAAFAVPWIVDWNEHRAYFEEQASEIIGRPVTIEGDVEVRIAPFPILRALNVRIGGEGSGEGVAALSIRGGLMPLLSGEVHVTELVLDRPRLRLSVSPDGFVSWGMETEPAIIPVAPASVRVDEFVIRDGTIVVEDARHEREYAADNIDISGSAASLAGPYRFGGSARAEGRSYRLRVALGRVQPERGVRIGATLEPSDRPVSIVLDGELAFADGQPHYDGQVQMRSRAPTEAGQGGGEAGAPAQWLFEARARATPERLTLEELAIRIGGEEHPTVLSGAAQVQLGRTPRFDAVLSSRQVDLDRALGGGPDAPVPPHAAIAVLGRMFTPDALPMGGALSLDVGAVVLGGDIIENLGAELIFDGGMVRIERAQAVMPGQADATLSGGVTSLDEATRFKGAVSVAARNAGPLATWVFRQDALLPGFGAVAGDLRASASVELGPDGFALDRLQVSTERNTLNGAVRYASPSAAGGVLDIALRADELDLRGLPVESFVKAVSRRAAGEGEPLEVRLDLDAGRLVGGVVTAEGVQAKALLTGPSLAIERLAIGQVGGLGVTARGQLAGLDGTPTGDMTVNVEIVDAAAAARAAELLELADVAAVIRRRAATLAPGALTASIGTASGSSIALDLQGEIAGTAVEGRLAVDDQSSIFDDIAGAQLDLDLTAKNDAGERLMAQLGVAAGGSAAPGTISLTASGRPREGLRFRLAGDGPGLAGTVEGTATWPAGQPREVVAEAALDLGAPARLLGNDGLGRLVGLAGPGRLTARLDAAGARYEIRDLVYAGERRLTGSLTVVADEASLVRGELQADSIDLGALLAATTGTDTFLLSADPQGPHWSDATFALVEPGDWDLSVDLRADDARWGEVALSGLAATLSADEGGIAYRDVTASLWDGQLVADLELQMLRGVLNASARLELSDAEIPRFVWRVGDQPAATGRLDVGLDLAGGGRSALALVSTLAGEGSLTARQGVVRRMNPDAFETIVARLDATEDAGDLTEATVTDLLLDTLDKGALRYSEIQGAITASGGVLRVGRVPVATPQLSAFVTASLDLPALTVSADWLLRASEAEEGRAQEATIRFRGPVTAPERELFVDPLVSYLTVRRFEQEMERLEDLQSEILERERLGRQLLQLGRERRERENAAEQAEESAQPATPAPADQGASAPAEADEAVAGDTAPAQDPIVLDREEFRRTIQDLLREDGLGGSRSGRSPSDAGRVARAAPPSLPAAVALPPAQPPERPAP